MRRTYSPNIPPETRVTVVKENIKELFYSLTAHLLRRDLVGGSSEVNLLVNVHTGNDEEDSRPPSPACQQPTQSETLYIYVE